MTYYDKWSYYIFWKYKILNKGVQVIYAKCCPCGGDVEINTDTQGKYHLTCIQCSREITKVEALGLLKKLQSSKVA